MINHLRHRNTCLLIYRYEKFCSIGYEKAAKLSPLPLSPLQRNRPRVFAIAPAENGIKKRRKPGEKIILSVDVTESTSIYLISVAEDSTS